MRGEKQPQTSARFGLTGSPPRARGKVRRYRQGAAGRRITPACAGKSFALSWGCPRRKDHPRVRGEKQTSHPLLSAIQGSPPRARGKVYAFRDGLHGHGITPACAGKRAGVLKKRARPWDHPRVRGEKFFFAGGTATAVGSPPRARGKARPRHPAPPPAGITPACAGKSPRVRSGFSHPWDHPRVRGEKTRPQLSGSPGWGSPPRARGKASKSRDSGSPMRITPACAGKSKRKHSRDNRRQDHPRVRGEKR